MNEIIKNKVIDEAIRKYGMRNYASRTAFYDCAGFLFDKGNLWISVKEALPNPMEEVVVIDENGNTSLACVNTLGVWIANKTNGTYDVTFDYGKITHWMPIPKLIEER